MTHPMRALSGCELLCCCAALMRITVVMLAVSNLR